MQENEYFKKYLDSKFDNVEHTLSDQTIKIENLHSKLDSNIDKMHTKISACKKEHLDRSDKYLTHKQVGMWSAGWAVAIYFFKEILKVF